MSQFDQDVWHRLRTGQYAQAEELWAQRALVEGNSHLLAALDIDGRRHLLVQMHPNDPEFHDIQSRGIGVVTRELAMPGHAPSRYLDIVCHDLAGHDTFNLIGEELAERLTLSHETVIESVAHVLSKWRRFWGQLPQQFLASEIQLGLFAELWFLNFWLIPRLGLLQAVGAWRGPFGARHDFECAGHSIEVKSTTSTRGAIHRIHGIEQLSPPENGKLLMFSLRLREEIGSTNSLPTLIAACRQQIKSNDESWSHFESALAQAGYLDAHEGEYSKRHFRIVSEALYSVHADFPRLTSQQIIGGIPIGIEHIDYDVNLAGFEHYRIAEKPSDPFPI